MSVSEILVRKLKEHTRLSREDVDLLQSLPFTERILQPNEDLVSQGERPHNSALVTSGMVGRFHLRPGGRRQYISFHVAGDWPDLQSLFLDQMDHSVCATGAAQVALVSHEKILDLFESRPAIGLAFWRETLIDASIFRDAITNNSSRGVRARIAHFFCEQYYRAQAAGLSRDGSCYLPLSQVQIGETLGISVVTTNRGMQALRRTGVAEFRRGRLFVRNWRKLQALGEFDPRYLHLTRQNRI
jgi:CRP-like cAMP-binding protein